MIITKIMQTWRFWGRSLASRLGRRLSYVSSRPDISLVNAVESAKRTISDVCARRPCLSDCLSRLDRVSAAGRRGAPACPPPRSARGCHAALVGIVAAALVAVPACLPAAVVCNWNGSDWDCSGDGNYIYVGGGGGGGGSGDIIVVTNIVGTCTNCTAILPDELAAQGLFVKGYADQIDGVLSSASGFASSIRGMVGDLVADCDASVSLENSISNLSAISNLWYVSQTKQAQAIRAAYPPNANGSVTAGNRNTVASMSQATKNYADLIKPSLQAIDQEAVNLEQYMAMQSPLVDDVRATGQLLIDSAQPCLASWDGGGGGGGGGPATNSPSGTVTGDWCTFEQGAAMTNSLAEIRDYLQRQLDHLKSVSNSLERIEYTVFSGLYSYHHNIPEPEFLDGTWQDIYFAGQSRSWGYEPTNVLQRIELLLYGIAGLGTNATISAGDDMEQDANTLRSQVSAFTTDATATPAESLGSAVASFLGAFTVSGDQFRGGEMLTEDTVIKFGDQEYTVPGLNVGQAGKVPREVGLFLDACRAMMTIIYTFIAVICLWRFWVMYAQWAIKVSRWAVDLVTSMLSA